MSYNTSGSMMRKVGYDGWTDFVSDESLPTQSGTVEMLQEANFVVNFAYHNLPSNSSNANHTGILGVYEAKVFKRMWVNNQGVEAGEGKIPFDDYLLEAERNILGTLGGAKPVMVKINRSRPIV